MQRQGKAMKLIKQLKSGLKGTFNWNKYQSKVEKISQNPYLNHLIDPSFEGVSKVCVFII